MWSKERPLHGRHFRAATACYWPIVDHRVRIVGDLALSGAVFEDRNSDSEGIDNTQLLVNDLPVLQILRVESLSARNQRGGDQNGVVERKSIAFEYRQTAIVCFDSDRFNSADGSDRIENLADFIQRHL
jgi:hypothetical protein